MKVYVIVCGLYSDKWVYGATLSEEKTKQIVAEIERENENIESGIRSGRKRIDIIYH